MSALTRKIISDITHRKVRTLLTVLGIAIGVMGLSAINIAASQLKSSFQYTADVSAQPDLNIFTGPTSGKLTNILAQQENVKAIQPQVFVSTRWTIASGHFPIDVVGLSDFHNVQINKFKLVEGHLPGVGQIVLESSNRAIEPVPVGNQIEIVLGGVAQKLTVSGYVRTQGRLSTSLLQRALGYMPQDYLMMHSHIESSNDFLILVKNSQQRDTTLKLLLKVFEAQHVAVGNMYVGHDTTPATLTDGLFSTMRLLSMIALLLSVFLLIGTVTTLVAEQLPIIGTMKAIGARQLQVVRHYLAIVMLYGLIGTCVGGVLGIVGGYLLVSYLCDLLNLDIGSLIVSPFQVLTALSVGIGTPLLAAIIPIYLGTRITAQQALSGYELDNGRKTRRVSGVARGMRWSPFAILPQTLQFGVRNLFRKRVRATLTLITLVMCGIAFLAVQTTTYSCDLFLSQLFDTYHYDVLVSLSNPQPYSTLQRVLTTVPGIQRIEPLEQYGVNTKWGLGILTGVEPATQLYQKHMVAGRWFTASDRNVVVLSQDAANKAHLNVGNSIALSGITVKANWHIIGIARDYGGINPGQFGTLLAPIQQVNIYIKQPVGYTQSVMVQTTSSTLAETNSAARRLDNTMSHANLQATVTTALQEKQRPQSEFQILSILLDVVTCIVALVSVMGLFNALAMSVLERRREIGILRSLGATSGKVAQVFWVEGVTLGMTAWLIAIVLGIPAAYGFVLFLDRLLFPVPFAFNPLDLFMMLGFVLFVTSLASIGPVLGAMHVKIVQTLRYE